MIPLSAMAFSDQTGKIINGLVQLTAVNKTDPSQYRPLAASVVLPWRCEALDGTMQVQTIVTALCRPLQTLPFFYTFSLLKQHVTAFLS